jgi:peptide/nickel transport system permease protein
MSRIRGSAKRRLRWLVLSAAMVALPLPFVGSPTRQDLEQKSRPPASIIDLGTDQMGRSLGARLYFGLLRSAALLSLTLCSTLVIAAPTGLTAARSPKAEVTIDIVADAVWSIPTFVIVLLVFMGIKGQWIPLKYFCLGFFNWVPVYRVIRDASKRVAATGYVRFARALGMSEARVYGSAILPNLFGAVAPTVLLGLVSLLELDFLLSFLGLSYPDPAPTLGGILRQGIDYLQLSMILLPAGTIVAIVLLLVLLARRFGSLPASRSRL